jgi:hypothetical protein
LIDRHRQKELRVCNAWVTGSNPLCGRWQSKVAKRLLPVTAADLPGSQA